MNPDTRGKTLRVLAGVRDVILMRKEDVVPPALAKYVTISLAYRGESMRMFPLGRVTK